MDTPSITDREFSQFQKLIYDIAGINMSPIKKPLVTGRLAKRLNHYSLKSYSDYYTFITSNGQGSELQIAVDLLTTNETYFFREPKHYDFLQREIMPGLSTTRNYRVWSAACSSGQEAYSTAMVLDTHLGNGPWEIIASDISMRVLEKARRSQYPIDQARNIPKEFLNKYCLRGIGTQNGSFIIERHMRSKIKFHQINLNEPLPFTEKLDLIFLRNVMIYFDAATKRKVLERIAAVLKPGGYLFIGHSESLNGIYNDLTGIAPAIYRNPLD